MKELTYYKKRIKALHLSVSEAARLIGEKPVTLHHYLSGRLTMRDRVKSKLDTMFIIRKRQLLDALLNES